MMSHVRLLMQWSTIVKSKQRDDYVERESAKTQGITFSSEIPPHERSTCSEVIPSFHHYSRSCYQSEHLYIQRKGRKVSQGHPKPGIRGKSYLEVDIFQVLASHESADSVVADGKRDFVAYSHSNPKNFTLQPLLIKST